MDKGLFEETMGSQRAKRLLYGLTNRSNVLEMLSSGVAKPSSSYHKYYRDLLELVPGYVPLFSGSISQTLQDYVGSEPGQFPVAYIVEVDRVPGKVPLGPNVAVRVFPTSCINKLVFRNQKELRDFSAREYENVPLQGLELVVGEADFWTEGQSLEDFRAWATTLPQNSESESRIQIADKLVGAYTVLAAWLPGRRDWAEWLANEWSGIKAVGPSLSLESCLLAEKKTNSDDHRLLRAVVRALVAVPSFQGLDPDNLVCEIESDIGSKQAKRRDDLSHEFRVVSDVLAGTVDIREAADKHLSPITTSLLLALLRSSPAKFLASSETASDQLTEAVPLAALFVGLLSGYSALPLDLRGSKEFQSEAADLIAYLSMDKPQAKRPALVVKAGEGQIDLVSGNKLVLRRYLKLREQLKTADLRQGVWKRVALELDRRLGLGCTSTRISLEDSSFSVTQVQGGHGLQIEIPGIAIVTRVLDEERFRESISKSQIPEILEQELRARIQEGLGESSKGTVLANNS